MTKAIAATAYQQQNPLKAALFSAENFVKFSVDLMYGTPKRIQYTMTAMMVLMVLSLVMENLSKTILQTCPI